MVPDGAMSVTTHHLHVISTVAHIAYCNASCLQSIFFWASAVGSNSMSVCIIHTLGNLTLGTLYLTLGTISVCCNRKGEALKFEQAYIPKHSEEKVFRFTIYQNARKKTQR